MINKHPDVPFPIHQIWLNGQLWINRDDLMLWIANANNEDPARAKFINELVNHLKEMGK